MHPQRPKTWPISGPVAYQQLHRLQRVIKARLQQRVTLSEGLASYLGVPESHVFPASLLVLAYFIDKGGWGSFF